jgi:hypothetical protein
MIAGPGGKERGPTLRDNPGVLAGTTLDQATTPAPVADLVADLLVVHGAVSVLSVDPVIRVSMVVKLGFDRLQHHRQPAVVHYDR